MNTENAARSGRDPIVSCVYENIATLATQSIKHGPSFHAKQMETCLMCMFTAVCESSLQIESLSATNRYHHHLPIKNILAEFTVDQIWYMITTHTGLLFQKISCLGFKV